MRSSPLRAAGGTLGPLRAWPPLVAVAHGSTDPRAAATITDLMGLVRVRARRGGLPGLQVRAAYLGHALPPIPDVLEALHAGAAESPPPRSGRGRASPGRHGGGLRGAAPAGQHGGGLRGAAPPGRPSAVVLPLLLTAAYHSDTDLSEVLQAAGRRLPGLHIRYGQPLGPHPLLLCALERRLAEAGVPASRAGAAGTAVVLAAAGSSRPSANAAVARVATAWQAARGWRDVVPAYASAASPTPGQAVAGLLRAGAARVVVASYLLAPGVFADKIREQSLAAGAGTVSAALGAAPEVADVILDRYLQAANGTGTNHQRSLCWY
jgi:sirohydrochlorin ferrochelatase